MAKRQKAAKAKQARLEASRLRKAKQAKARRKKTREARRKKRGQHGQREEETDAGESKEAQGQEKTQDSQEKRRKEQEKKAACQETRPAVREPTLRLLRMRRRRSAAIRRGVFVGRRAAATMTVEVSGPHSDDTYKSTRPRLSSAYEALAAAEALLVCKPSTAQRLASPMGRLDVLASLGP